MNEIRTIFLDSCNKIASLLNNKGFKALQKGQLLKKISSNKDLSYDIFFQSSTLNFSTSIIARPIISIFSVSLKKWMIKQTGNPHESGLVFTSHLGNICPCGYKDWNFAGISGKNEILQIAELLNHYALPIFNLFDDTTQAVDFLKSNGTKFNKYTEESLIPLGFMIHYATKEDAESFFNSYISSCSYKGKFISLYKELQTSNKIDLNHSEFVGASQAKLAFINGLKLGN